MSQSNGDALNEMKIKQNKLFMAETWQNCLRLC